MTDFTPHQLEQIDRLLLATTSGERVIVLTGPAGSGKTTCVREYTRRVRELGYKCLFVAPTGKAAVRLKEITGEPTSTIHAVLYTAVKETEDGAPVFLNARAPCTPDTVLVVDEASMVDLDLHRELYDQLPSGSVILYVGDREQLPPVIGSWGPDFAAPTATLTEIHRQALDNPILAISSEIRAGGKLPDGKIGETYSRSRAQLDQVATWVADQQDSGDDVVVLCWTNNVRQKMNRLIRRIRGLDTAPISVGDRVLVRYNNKRLGRMNGEICVVTTIRRPRFDENYFGIEPSSIEEGALELVLDTGTTCYVHPDLIGVPFAEFREAMKKLSLTTKDQWLHVDYGQAITVHTSQGSEWQTVVFVIDDTTRFLARRDPDQARRLVYTGVTRAKKRLIIFDT